MSTQIFTTRQRRALERLGDVMLPSTPDAVSFSESGCSARADDVVEYLPEQDRKDLLTVFTVLSFMPTLVLRLVIKLVERAERARGPLGPTLRLLQFALKGVITSLYYSDEAVLARMGYEVSVYTADLDGGSSPVAATSTADADTATATATGDPEPATP